MPTFPWWWSWELEFTTHMLVRMKQRHVTEVDIRAMLESARAIEPGKEEGRFVVRTRHAGHPWIVIVEPESDTRRLVVVTHFEVIA